MSEHRREDKNRGSGDFGLSDGQKTRSVSQGVYFWQLEAWRWKPQRRTCKRSKIQLESCLGDVEKRCREEGTMELKKSSGLGKVDAVM
jgi:hypothetical protein